MQRTFRWKPGYRAWSCIWAALVTLSCVASSAWASDHTDAPAVAFDPAADLLDLYAWHHENSDLMTVIITFAQDESAAEGTYDPDVLYTLHFDTNNDNRADLEIYARFGAHKQTGAAGVWVDGIPGESGPVFGPVETTLGGTGANQVWAGFADDPFFFDIQGFQDSLLMLSYLFTGADGMAGRNATAIVVEFDASSLPNTVQIWATTGRINN